MRFDQVAALADLVDALPARSIIGIAGAPGAGKSTIAAALVAAVPGAVLLPMDGYHYPQAVLRRLGRRERMGAPDTFDVPAFVDVLHRIRSLPPPAAGFRNDGEPVLARGFDRVIEEPVEAAVAIYPSFRKLVVEGNYLLLDGGGWERVAPLLDVTVFVEVDDGIRLDRLVARHVAFGKSRADAEAWARGPDDANARVIAATAGRAQHTIALAADR